MRLYHDGSFLQDPIEGANAAARLLGALRDGRFRSYVQV
jgi:hypothetical protein